MRQELSREDRKNSAPGQAWGGEGDELRIERVEETSEAAPWVKTPLLRRVPNGSIIGFPLQVPCQRV